MKSSSIIIIFIVFILSSTFYNPSAKNINLKEILEDKNKTLNNNLAEGTEYWALIVGVGIYYKHPEQNRPMMLQIVEDLPDILMESHNWKSDHIHTLKGSDATVINLVKELLWLIKNTDEDDMVLVYITTHGSPMKFIGQPIDFPPIDEADHADEILIMYHGFDRWFSFFSDDMLNYFLSMIKSNNICLIVDSCYSGGFNDIPFFKQTNFKKDLTQQDFNSELFIKEFTKELSSQNRIILMSCEEDKLSWGNIFSIYILFGLSDNLADIYGNNDGINSAEETFYYADKMVNEMGSQNPTILDLYPGEFALTYV